MTGSSREFYGTGTNFFRYRYRYFFPGPIFSGTGTGTFFWDQIFPVPVPVLFSGTKFFRYRYRYFFPGPIFSGTGTGTIQKGAKFPGPGIPGTGMSHSGRYYLHPSLVLFPTKHFNLQPVTGDHIHLCRLSAACLRVVNSTKKFSNY